MSGRTRTIAVMSEALQLGQAQPRLGELLRRATQHRERITITDPAQPVGPAAVLMSAEELMDLEDALAFALCETRAAAGTQVLVPHAEAKAKLGLT
jgi:prevent-host-death family protein